MFQHIFQNIFLQEILNNEDCEDLDPGSGSIHSAGSINLNQHHQRASSSNRIQLSSTRPGQNIGGGASLSGNEKRASLSENREKLQFFKKWNMTTSIQTQLMPNLFLLFVLATVDYKFPIKTTQLVICYFSHASFPYPIFLSLSNPRCHKLSLSLKSNFELSQFKQKKPFMF